MVLCLLCIPLLVGCCAIAGTCLVPVLLTAIGFGPAGIIAGSIAAFFQTPFIAAGSLFAILQSIGATGAAAAIGVKIGFAASVLLSATLGIFKLIRRLTYICC